MVINFFVSSTYNLNLKMEKVEVLIIKFYGDDSMKANRLFDGHVSKKKVINDRSNINH